MRPMRLGIVGLGVISKFYLRALRDVPEVRLAGACDRDERALAPLNGRTATYRDHRDLLRRENLDAVLVTVPNDAHAQVCHDALDAGLAVCVEKPLATRLDDGRALLDHAHDRRLPLFTAFHRRYNTAVDNLRRSLQVGTPIESVTVRYFERIEEHAGRDAWYLDPRRCGGGCVADNGPNAFDLVRLFLGEVEVTGATVLRDGWGIDRQATVALRTHTAQTATVELDWSYPGERKDLEVRLADGGVHRADLLAGHSGFKASLWHEYVAILRDFVSVSLCGSPSPSPDPGMAALALVDATYRAERGD